MKSRALTPVFQWIARRAGPTDRAGILSYSAPVAGNHAGEAVFLAISTALLTATAVASITAGMCPAWLRWSVGLILLFLLPHVVMALVSLASSRIAGTRWHRGLVQDWSCLLAMTGYAAWRCASTNWTGRICQAWLAFMAANATVALVQVITKRHRG